MKTKRKIETGFSNLLVTGGCGFIGSNFIRNVLNDASFFGRIINLDKLTYAGNPENLEGIAVDFGTRYVFQKVDICNAGLLENVFGEYDIDAVCHFAAESHVDRSIKDPGSFIQTNIVGTFNLLEIAKARGDKFKLFHHVSTDEVYGSLGAEGLFREDTPYRPNSPYSASKAASDHLVRAYHETFGLPTTISNCSNNYGPYQFPEKLIPLVVLNALEGKPLPVYGDGKNVRDWLYVKDHCSAIRRVLADGKLGETYNIGGWNEKPNLEVINTLCEILGELAPRADGLSYKSQISFVKDRAGHDRRYAIDASKIERELGWVPSETFETGIRKTIQWYLDHQGWVENIVSGDYRSWVEKQYQ